MIGVQRHRVRLLRLLSWTAWSLALGAIACGGTTETAAGGGASGGDGGGGVGGMAAGGMGTGGTSSASVAMKPTLPAQSCAPGTYAVAIDGEGMFSCAAFDPDVKAAVDARCDLHFGWRDNCNGCDSGPAKVGRVSGAGCDNLAGGDNTCTTPTLGGSSAPLFGLNTDGDVDGNDMFFAGWHCPPLGRTGSVGPCGPDEHAVYATVSGSVECMPAERIVTAYVRQHCALYFGWRDNCDGCADPPSKWGWQRGVDCSIGAGEDNHCGASLLDGQWVPLVGINTDGDVDGNDTFFVGLHCESPSPQTLTAADRCPFGTLLTGVDDDGALLCRAPVDAIGPVVRQSCQVTFGYRDSCNGCTDPPVKWGRSSTESCDPGTNASCGVQSLDGTAVQLLGINTDGDVDGNDKLYVGLSCL